MRIKQGSSSWDKPDIVGNVTRVFVQKRQCHIFVGVNSVYKLDIIGKATRVFVKKRQPHILGGEGGGEFSVQTRSAVVCVWRNHIKFTIRYQARDTYRTEQRLTMYVVNIYASVGLVCRPEPGINTCIDTGCKECTDCQYESFQKVPNTRTRLVSLKGKTRPTHHV